MSATVEITGTFVKDRWRSDDGSGDFAISVVRPLSGDQELFGSEICVLGNSDPGELTPQCEYRFYGFWEDNEQHGRQFKFKTFVRSTPHGRAGVIRYLQDVPDAGLGLATATALWNKFGPDAVRIVRETPDVASAAVSRWSVEHATVAAAYLKDMQALEGCTIDLIDLLDKRGFPKATAREAVKRWGNRAAEIIKADPYKLMAFRGCGFVRCDAMYLDLGLPPAKMKRQVCCAWHAVTQDREGHTWLPIATARQGIRAKIAGTETNPDKAVSIGVRLGALQLYRDCPECSGLGTLSDDDLWSGTDGSCWKCGGSGGSQWIGEGTKARAEQYCADKIAAMMGWPNRWQEVWRVGIVSGALDPCTDHQREGLQRAIAGAMGILGGGPGVGKTWSLAALVRAILKLPGHGSIAVACPTGKAAVRCSEAMAAYQLPLVATTIHRLLGVESVDDQTGTWGFRHRETNPLPVEFLIVDEFSMVGTGLLSSLLRAIAKGTHVLFVGDVNQLAPVEHGAPLRDLIRVGVPYGELREIKRNAGTIVTACAQIRDGQMFDTDEVLCPSAEPPRNLKLVPANKDQAPTEILDIIRQIRDRKLGDPIWDVQVIVAVNKRSPLARVSLNRQLQDVLNPNGQKVDGSPFRVGDKVIQLKNGFLKDAGTPEQLKKTVANLRQNFNGMSLDDALGSITATLEQIRDTETLTPPDDSVQRNPKGEVFVANGEFGRVLEVEAKRTVVEFRNPTRRVVIYRGKQEGDDNKKKADDDAVDDTPQTGCDLDLGYAATCHRMQGSECRFVVVALDEYPGATGRFGVCDMSWLNTALSRAVEVCFLVGKKSTALAQMRKKSLDRRKTFLVERILDARDMFSLHPAAAEKFSARRVDEDEIDEESEELEGTEATT